VPTLYLIDGYAQFFRAYHAIRTPMTSPVTKEPTNLTFGFVGMLLKLLKGEGQHLTSAGTPADFLAVAIDKSSDTGTFRSAIYPDYKAHRPPPPEDLPAQVTRCLALLNALGVPVLGVQGFEADDVIATLITQLTRQHPDLRVRIVSKDKDFKQLLASGSVEMYDIHTDALITEGKLKQELGLTPPQIIDMLALMGDNVDNVPGVDGVGEKTAAMLVALYGSVDAVIAAAPTIKGKRGENLRAAADLVKLSRSLVALRHDAPVTMPLDAASTAKLNLPALLPILKELGFNRYQDEVRALLGQPLTGQPTSGAARPKPAPTSIAPATTAPKSPTRKPTKPAKSDGDSLFDAPLFADATSQPTDLYSATNSPTHHTSTASPWPDGLGALAATLDATLDVHGRVTATDASVYRCVRTHDDLAALAAELRAATIFALDTETTGLSPIDSHLVGLSFSTAPGTGWYVPLRSPTPDQHLDQPAVLAVLKPILELPTPPRCGHNLKFDTLVLRRAGVRFAGFAFDALTPDQPAPSAEDQTPSNPTPNPIAIELQHRPTATAFDSMLASYLIDATRSSHGLDALALALLQHTNISIKELIGTGARQRTFDHVPLGPATLYAAEDADIALRLHHAMSPQLDALGQRALFERLEMPLVEVLAELEWNGVRVDPAELDRQRERLAALMADVHRAIDQAANDALARTFNPDSPKQLAAALFNKPTDETPGLGLKPIKRTATGFSTDIEVLEALTQDASVTTPIPRLILEHRQLTKLVGTYLVALKDAISPTTARVHASFNQTVAATGRLSSSDPNLQNIPIRTDMGRDIRRAFVAEPGWLLVSADYSQIELRLLAHLSQDPGLIHAFATGQDIHAAVAAQINNVPLDQVTKAQRDGAKMVNFGIVYGITTFGLARRLGCPNAQAEAIITGYKKRFAGITTFLQECVDHAQRLGYVATMLGRRRAIPEIESTNPSRRALAERTAINTVVQGSAADLIKLAMVDLHRLFRGDPAVRTLLQVHDELVVEARADRAEDVRLALVHRMERAMKLSVPLKADSSIAPTWFEG